MQDPRATARVSSFDLLKDVRAALGFDLVRRLLNQRVTVKARNPGVDCVFDVLEASWTLSGSSGSGSKRVVLLLALYPFGSFRERFDEQFRQLADGVLIYVIKE